MSVEDSVSGNESEAVSSSVGEEIDEEAAKLKTANVITLAGEGLVLALCTVFPKVKFGIMKIICDCSMVVIAVALSFIFLQRLDGVREGTIAAAVLVGLLSKQFNKFITPLGNKIFMSGYKYLKEGEKDK